MHVPLCVGGSKGKSGIQMWCIPDKSDTTKLYAGKINFDLNQQLLNGHCKMFIDCGFEFVSVYKVNCCLTVLWQTVRWSMLKNCDNYRITTQYKWYGCSCTNQHDKHTDTSIQVPNIWLHVLTFNIRLVWSTMSQIMKWWRVLTLLCLFGGA